MNKRQPHVSLIIPTFNEKENIVPLVEQISSQMADIPYEILIVDDMSTDGTLDIIRRSLHAHRRVRFFSHSPPRDLGGSIFLGIQRSRGAVLIGMDGDGNHDPAVIPELLHSLRHADLVVASRFVTGGGMENGLRYMASNLFNSALRVFFKFPIRDNTSGYYAIGKKKLELLHPHSIYKGYGEYFLRLVYRADQQGLRIHEVPVYYRSRLSGYSKSNLITMMFTYLHAARELFLTHR